MPPVPADIELKLPDGFQANETDVGQFKAIAKELGLKSEQAQRVFDLYANSQQQAIAAVEKRHAGWVEALKTDKEFGGSEFLANAKIAGRAVAKYGTPELREFLETSGLGNHPELVRAFYRMGKAMAEDSVAGSSGGAATGTSQEEFLRALYPNSPGMFPKSA